MQYTHDTHEPMAACRECDELYVIASSSLQGICPTCEMRADLR